jgi:NAD(P)-dependent dehydrogenase (short-subunit alcohol dehydrogenase family)
MNNLFDLTGKTAVITGGAGLLGAHHARAVAAYGGTPVLLDLSQAAVDSAAIKLNEEFHTQAAGFAVNITQEDAVANVCKQVLSKFGRVDVLINNAANNPKVDASGTLTNASRLEHFPLDIWNQDIAVGLTGSFLCAKYFGQAMAEAGRGSIINISSDLGIIAPDQRLYRKEGLPEQQQSVKPVTYSVIKTGLIGLTRYLATYWADKGVRCNALCPGGVLSGQGEDFLVRIKDRIPLGRMANADEYEGSLVFLASDASSYMTGAVLVVDGGRSCW